MLVLICWLIAVPPAVILVIFSLETVLGTAALKVRQFAGRMPRTRILMPAHNEAGTIEETLRRLAPVLSDSVSLLVVADNCSDETAQLVRLAGHEVIERVDPDRRGKGFALAFGRDHMQAAPPECVIIFDADCETDARSIEMLAKSCMEDGVPVQASYILQPDLSASPKVQISNFAFWVKNIVRQRGGHRLGSAALLCGTGMAFPWEILATAPLATSEVVEDLALGVHLTRIGKPPVFLEQALVRSVAAAERATLDQRSRWEVGFVTVARTIGMDVLRSGIMTRNRKVFQLGLNLLVPPLALLLMLSFVIGIAVAFGAWLTQHWAPFFVLAIPFALALMAVLANWVLAGHRWLSLKALVSVPLYIVWKIPVYLRIVKGGELEWNRTERTSGRQDL